MSHESPLGGVGAGPGAGGAGGLGLGPAFGPYMSSVTERMPGMPWVSVFSYVGNLPRNRRARYA